MTDLRVRAALALLALLGCFPGAVAADDLISPFPAPAPVAYRGRKVVIDFTRQGPHVASMSVLCRPDGRERREFHATRGFMIVDGESAWQYQPERGVVIRRPARTEGGETLRPEQLERARASYAVRVLRADRIAGRPSRAFEFAPRQPGSRPRRVVWMDEQTGLVLKTEVYGTDGRLIWLSLFEELEYRPAIGAEAFRMQLPRGVRVVDSGDEPCLEPGEAERVAGLPVALPAYLPEGFARQCIRARRRGGSGEIQVVFGDGLSLLTLFASANFRETDAAGAPASPVEVGHATGRWHDLGPVNGISWRAPWAHLALLGELSREELHKVAGSVRGGAELPGPGERR